MNRLGKPIPMLANKEIPGPAWEVSEETIKEIEDLEERNRLALAHLWHWYV